MFFEWLFAIMDRESALLRKAFVPRKFIQPKEGDYWQDVNKPDCDKNDVD